MFLLIGLQARWILRDVQDSGVPVSDVVTLCLSTFVAVIVLRLVWVFPARFLLVRPGPDRETGEHPSWQHTMVLGWAGMRGVVTLAAAFAIPEEFAYRETLILTALFVAAGTLFVQGSTLPWLVRRLRLPAPDPREDALARAALFEKASAAGLEVLDLHHNDDDPFNTVQALRDRAAQRNTAAWERLGGTSPDEETPSESYARLRLEMLNAERAKVLHVRTTGEIPHEVVEDVLATLDVEESMLDIRNARQAEVEHAETVSGIAGTIAPARTWRTRRGRRLAGGAGVRGLRARRVHPVGAPAQVPGVRAHGLLRLLAAPAREPALRRDRTPGDALGRARRGVALVLRGQPAGLTEA